MSELRKKDEILHDHNQDGVDRRGFLKCMAWAGTGAFCVMQGGVLKSYSLSRLAEIGEKESAGELSFVQISDSHMGFDKAANPDVVGTLKTAVERINALPRKPEFMLHTGDVSHLSRPAEFDTVEQVLKTAAWSACSRKQIGVESTSCFPQLYCLPVGRTGPLGAGIAELILAT
jgi:3',5'-cyclic-AMP phosphodiesterase